jgi:hypothetical protein
MPDGAVLPSPYLRCIEDLGTKGATGMLYGTTNQRAILAADLRSGDRHAADRARTGAAAASTARPSDHERAAVRGASDRSGRSAAPGQVSPARWSLRLIGRLSR